MNQRQLEHVQAQVRRWRDELINLSRRNRLLYFKHTRSSTLEIEAPGLHELLALIERNGTSGVRFFEPPLPRSEAETYGAVDIPDEPEPRSDEIVTQKDDPRHLATSLTGLYRRSIQEFMDKGLWVLYLGVGFLEWEDPEIEQKVHSPLLLYPVQLLRDNPRDPFRLARAEEDVVVNPSLAVKLETAFGIQIPQPDDIELDDLPGYFEQVRGAVANREWRVASRVVLSVFSFHKEEMYRDLKENEDAIIGHPVVQALALGPEAGDQLGFEPVDESELDARYPPEETITILDADASQRRSLAAVEAGESFVMDGPPGTGKSQTIANMIAASIAGGRTVLFVSEKAAALEVVASRLAEVGLAEYLLELHSHKATRKEFAQGLAAALRRRPAGIEPLPRTELAKLRARRLELTGYVQALNEVRPSLGQTLHTVLGRIAQLQTLPAPPRPTSLDESLTADDLARLLDTAASWSRAWGPVERGDEFVWKGVRLTPAATNSQQRASAAVVDATEALDALRTLTNAAGYELRLQRIRSTKDAQLLLAVARHLEVRVDVPAHWLTVDDLGPALSRFEDLYQLRERYQAAVTSLEQDLGILSWRNLDPTLHGPAQHAVAFLSALDPPVVVPAQATLDQLNDRLVAVRRIQMTAGELIEVLPDLRRCFELSDERNLNLSDMARLGRLAEGVMAGHRPDERWLDPIRIRRVQEGVEVLREAIDRYQDRAERLRDVFTPEVLDLDLESLVVRFERVHTGLHKLGSSYRADKRAVAAVTRLGQASRQVRALLPEALEWQRLGDALKRVESEWGDTVGDVYYRGPATDFERIETALSLGREMLELAGTLVEPHVLKHRLSVQAEPEPDLARLAEQVMRAVHRIGEAVEQLGLPAQALDGFTPLELVQWGAEGGDQLDLLHRVGTEVGAAAAGRYLAFDRVMAALAARFEVADVERSIEESIHADRELLGSPYQGMESDWDEMSQGLQWATGLRQIVGAALEPVTATAMLFAGLDPAPLADSLSKWDKARGALAGLFAPPRSQEIDEELTGSFDSASRLLADLERTIGDIGEWEAFTRAEAALRDEGLGDVAGFCVSQRLPNEQVARVVERAVLERWSDCVLAGDDRLATWRSSDRDAIVFEFRELDRKLFRHSAATVVAACNERRPATTIGASGIILQEGEKKRRHRPIRRLLAETRDVVQAIKPCFMMSPLSVSQFLDPDIRFDLVIFDEASQVRPSDAINCVYRGRQLVVVGDQRQLPPTTFFETVALDGDDDEYHEDQLEEFESVLDLAKAGGLESLPLRWHYRSRDEGLITYSNYSFYEGRLITFPSPRDGGEQIGIELFKVDGIYRRGSSRDNPVEAEKVAERVLFHATHHPHLSAGVVAFSEPQATMIEAKVDELRSRHPELDEYFTADRLDGFFVKNLENVQGDERDIILFSIGYGPDEVGKFTLNFGPLNKPGGERRLNVAITRARQKVEIITSVFAEDFGGSTTATGVVHLKRYLDFARRGLPALALELDPSGGDAESPFEEEVIRVIRSWGYETVPQVGVAKYRIDIGVRHRDRPGRFVLGVECDGAMYHSSPVARDRDRLRQEVLEGLGWRLHRIWGPSWYRDRTGEEHRLRRAIEEASTGSGSQGHSSKADDVRSQIEEVDLAAAPRWAVPYEVAMPRVSTGLAMHEPGALPAVRRAILQVVEVEAPVVEELVLRRVREAFGAGRSGNRIQAAFERAVAVLVRAQEIDRDADAVLWRHGDRGTRVRTPHGDPASQRKAAQVPIAEIEQAIRNLLSDAIAATQDELTASVARLFGWNRRGSEVAAALDTAVERLIHADEVVADGDLLRWRVS